jgi:Zn-dependent protease with chaperone function
MAEPGYFTGACEKCGGHIEFPAEGIGLSISCPHCAQETALLEEIGEREADGSISASELSSAVLGPIHKGRVSIIYQIALCLVACFMVILPIVYLGLIGALAYAIYWYAVTALPLISSFTGGLYVFVFRILLYVGPLVGGGVAVFFMFKPIFARPMKAAQSLALDPAANPRLYQFIAQICDLVGAPMPRRVDLNCDVGAYAGFRRGWFSLFGRDLVLTLGLPLVAGLTTKQLAAVVAHELGHFNQAFAMRLSYIIERIDRWFGRVVYARDAWDQMLDEWANSAGDWRVGLIVACAHFGVWLSRLMLKTLLFSGHAVTCLLSRQMEFSADQVAIAVAGSEAHEGMLVRLRELTVLRVIAYQGLGKFWTARRQLPENLPDFLTYLESKLEKGFHENARNTLLNESAGLFATHPTAAQRIQRARRAAEPGVFQLEAPASKLFRDFTLTSRFVTLSLYRDEMRLPVLPAMLKPVQVFIKD